MLWPKCFRRTRNLARLVPVVNAEAPKVLAVKHWWGRQVFKEMLGPPGPLRLEERLGCERFGRVWSWGKLWFRVEASEVDDLWVEESSRVSIRICTLSRNGCALWDSF